MSHPTKMISVGLTRWQTTRLIERANADESLAGTHNVVKAIIPLDASRGGWWQTAELSCAQHTLYDRMSGNHGLPLEQYCRGWPVALAFVHLVSGDRSGTT